MDVDGVESIKSKREEVLADRHGFVYLHELANELEALRLRAVRLGADELASELDFDIALVIQPISTERKELPVLEAALKAPGGMEKLRERMASSSVLVQALSARSLWTIDPKSRRESGAVAVKSFRAWFRSSSARALQEMSPDWMLRTLDVLKAAVWMSYLTGDDEAQRQICIDVVGFSKRALAVGQAEWMHAYARALLRVRGKVLSKVELGELLSVLDGQAMHARACSKFHVEQAFLEAVFDLRRAAKHEIKVAEHHKALAESFEAEAKTASSAFVRSHLYREAANAYRDALRNDDVLRVSMLLEMANVAAQDELKPVPLSRVSLPLKDVEDFFRRFARISIDEALVAVAIEPFFRITPEAIAREVESRERTTSLFSLLPVQFMGPENTEYIPSGSDEQERAKVVEAAKVWLLLPLSLLAETLRRLRRRGLNEKQVMGAILRGHVFVRSDIPFLLRGVRHWFAGDHLSALHVFVPFIEKTLRRISRGKMVSTIRIQPEGVEQAPMDTVLRNLRGRLPEDVLFAIELAMVRRGWWTLRHVVAHGLEDARFYDEAKSSYVLYLMLVLGGLVGND